MNKYSLFIDTTNNFCYVALYEATTLINDFKLQVNKNVTDLIVGSIDDLLIKSNVEKSKIKNLYVNIGPGTFTGVKVGVVVAKAWKLVYPKVKIFTLNSLRLQSALKDYISVIDAKSKKLYLAVYQDDKEVVTPKVVGEDDMILYENQYPTLKVVRDQIDTMYSNFTMHIDKAIEVKQLDNLEPLYLKDPV